MSGELDQLRAEVTRDTDAKSSAITVMTTLKTRLDAAVANNDMPAVAALATELGSTTDGLAAAIVANTPADPVARNRP